MNVMTAPKQAVNLTLNSEYVGRARALVGTRNLSAMIDKLLETYVRENEAKDADRKAQIAQWCAASNAFQAVHGLPGDEDSPY